MRKRLKVPSKLIPSKGKLTSVLCELDYKTNPLSNCHQLAFHICAVLVVDLHIYPRADQISLGGRELFAEI